jgi:phosphoglycerate dehydrogenase-like enzyme
VSTILLALHQDALSADQLARIEAAAPDKTLMQSMDEDEIRQHLDDIEIAVGHFPLNLLPEASNLRWFQQWSAGAEWLLDHPEVQEMDFTLTNASGVHAIPISEHIFAFLLAFARDLRRSWQAQLEHQWDELSNRDTFEVAGKTMLLIGVGEIGERTAHIADGLGMHVIGVRHDPSKEEAGVDEMRGQDDLLEVLPQADVVVSTVPLTEETRHMLGAAEFAAMKRGAYFINIGRGGTVDQEALIEALRSKQIAGAGMDVFQEEPLDQASPLWAMENVLITPHSSGVTPQYNERAFAIFIDNLERYMQGQALQKVVDKRSGY